MIAAFFTGGTVKGRKEELVTLQDQLRQLNTDDGWAHARKLVQQLHTGPHPLLPFHWEIEFPEVFAGDEPGFDSMVGNPPFAGKNTITRSNPDGYLHWLKVISPGAHGNADLVAHFFRRAYGLLRDGGTFGLIATNTIGQGDTRESGLRTLLAEQGGVIFRAQRRVKWPGIAAVVVSTVHMGKGPGNWPAPELDDKRVSRISAFLREGDVDETPATLDANKGIAFQGSIILGMGFTFDDKNAAKGKCEPLSTMHELIAKDPRNAERIKPYIGGDEINNSPTHSHHRYAIDFEDFPLQRDHSLPSWGTMEIEHQKTTMRKGDVPSDYSEPVAMDWPDLVNIVERWVKPDRLKQKRDSNRERWWIYAENRPGLMRSKRYVDNVFVQNCGAAPHLALAIIKADKVEANTLAVFAEDAIEFFAVIQSRIHEVWARLLSSSLEDRLRYTPTDCFQTFAIPPDYKNDPVLGNAAQNYLDYRAELMQARDQGMTKTYNRFHDLYCVDNDIVELRRLHGVMDDAVLRAYGWDDLAEQAAGEAAPRFLDEEDEPEYAYQGRYFWPAWFRDRVLARLLELNQRRAAGEATQQQANRPKSASKRGTDKRDGEEQDIQGKLV